MPLCKEEWIRLEKKADQLRHDMVDTVFHAHSGHLGGALSMVDIVTLLYYKLMKFDPAKPEWEDRDRFVLSKGHAGVGFVTILADLGLIEKEELKTFNLTGSRFGIHLDARKAPGVDASTGSLGHGLSIALGMALAARQLKKDFKVYCLLGDGECNEGSVWEAAMAANQFQLNRLVTMIDRNACMIDGPTEEIMKLEPFAEKWRSFGFHTLEVDGHHLSDIFDALAEIDLVKDKPCCLILNTVKGQGVDFAAGDFRWHYGAIDEKLAAQAHESLSRYHAERLQMIEEA